MSYKNEILLDVFRKNPVSRPPVWVMRQAGRILPNYRKIRASVSGFKELVKTPDLIAEATIEPLDELGVDAAILFSDILVIPEAMGLDYLLVEKVGPRFPETISDPAQIDALRSGEDTLPYLQYVFDSIKTTKAAIDGRTPLIGFAGAPWTLFAYMIEGGGSKTFSKARRFLYEQPEASHRLMQKITDSIISYLRVKIESGVDVIQLFDSWAEMLPVDQYREFALRYCEQILASVEGTPKIFFPKGAWSSIPHMKGMSMDALGLDWKTSPAYARQHLGNDIILQGNMDPCAMYASKPEITTKTHAMLDEFGTNHVVNLGHGVYPDTDRAHVKHFIDSIKEYRY